MNEAVKLLKNSHNQLLKKLQEVVNKNPKNFDYKTFGTTIEEYVEKELIEIFTKGGFIKNIFDYHKSKDKNEFPDFTLNINPKLAIEVKSGNLSKKDKGRWVSCNNSNNDMGTLNSWEDKINDFGGDNIYYLFIIYNFNDTKKEIVRIEIEPFYKFIGQNSDGLLKYREKDGNLRPKNFNEPSPFNTFEEFNKLFNGTVIYRAKRIIQKHIESVPKEERNKFLDSLKI